LENERMSFEINPPDEPCPDCGSPHHRECDLFYRHLNWKAFFDDIEQNYADDGAGVMRRKPESLKAHQFLESPVARNLLGPTEEDNEQT
jgi:hypothetical protein